jgi:hypothetical protein
MVQNNPGDPVGWEQTKYFDPSELKALEYTGMTTTGEMSGTQAVDFHTLGHDFFPAGSAQRLWLDAYAHGPAAEPHKFRRNYGKRIPLGTADHNRRARRRRSLRPAGQSRRTQGICFCRFGGAPNSRTGGLAECNRAGRHRRNQCSMEQCDAAGAIHTLKM